MNKKETVRSLIATTKDPLKIIIGSGGIEYEGWVATNKDVLDILSDTDWIYLFEGRLIDCVLAEHVWEHIVPSQQFQAAKMCFQHLKRGGILRVAVPDGYRTDPRYQEEVLPPKDGHTMIFTYRTLQDLFEQADFQVRLLEYFDEYGKFHAQDWNLQQGMIRRSLRFDNQEDFEIYADGIRIKYTSIIIDAVKPE